MEFLSNGFTLQLCDGAFPLSTDSMVLAHFARLPKQATVLDLGSGCGTLGLLMCAKDPGCTVTGVELTQCAHEAARENILRNGIPGRMKSICADLKDVPGLFPPGSFSCCISNPPYFSGGPAAGLTIARREDCCTAEDLFRSAAWALKYGGDFFLVHRPERMAELMALGSRYSLEAKRLGLVRHQEGAPVALILLQLRKGAKPGLLWEEITLRTPDGKPTPQYKEIYHIQED